MQGAVDLLLDVNTIVDHCLNRQPHAKSVNLAMAACQNGGGRLWIYTGSVQTLEYVTYSELRRWYTEQGKVPSNKQLGARSRQILHTFSEDKQWLSALAGEGSVFMSNEPEDEQLIRALNRFQPGRIKLLTRDEGLLRHYSEKTIHPEQYHQRDIEKDSVEFIDLKKQQDAIRPQLEEGVHRVLHHGRYIMGGEVQTLERRLETYSGAKHCITVASGTEALLISLMALGIGPGDEVITTPFTFVATAEVIVNVGAIPIFVDIQHDTGNIDPTKIEQSITSNTKAIIPVSLYGQPADMDEINAIAEKHGSIPVIEDAAQSFGATYKGRKSCNLSAIGCTSFFPSKPLGCYGDGGAIFTSDDEIAQACREIRVHGQSKRYVHTRIGVGGRMDTLQCAVVLAKLERFDWEVEQRQDIGHRYNQLLDEKGIQRVQQRKDRTSVFGQYTILVEGHDQLQQQLKEAGIPTAVHYPVSLNRQPAYQMYRTVEMSVSEQLASRVMSLPMYPGLTEDDQERVVHSLLF